MKKYTVIQHYPRTLLGITWDEYGLADYIYRSARSLNAMVAGWCTDSNDDFAEFLDVNERTVRRKLKKLVEKELIAKHPKKPYYRGTLKWENMIENMSFDKDGPEISEKYKDQDPKIISFVKDVGEQQADLILGNEKRGELAVKKKQLMRDWLMYLNQTKSKPIETGIQAQILIDNFIKYPIQDLRKLIQYSFENNYSKLYWDRIEK